MNAEIEKYRELLETIAAREEATANLNSALYRVAVGERKAPSDAYIREQLETAIMMAKDEAKLRKELES